MDIKLIKEHLEMLSRACDMDWDIERNKHGGYDIEVIIKKLNDKWYKISFHSYDIIDNHDINHILGQAGKEI